MCRAVTCKSCGKTTWAGCGQHVDMVMRGVPQRDRCQCPPSAPASGGGLLSKLFGR